MESFKILEEKYKIDNKLSENTVSPLTLFQMQSAFYPLGFGFIITVIVIICEILLCNRHNKKNGKIRWVNAKRGYRL